MQVARLYYKRLRTKLLGIALRDSSVSRLPRAIVRFAGRRLGRLLLAAAGLIVVVVGFLGYVGFESIIGMLDSRYAAELDAHLGIDRNAISRLHDPAYFAEQSVLVSEDERTVACISSPEHRILIKEVAALSDKIAVKVLNPHIERDETAAYGVAVTPAVAVEGAKDYGIRFLGIPAGYEFSNLIDSIVAVSTGEAGLTEETKTALAGLTEDVTIKVFATPT